MLLKSGSGGGGGRDVLFRLIAMADPASKKQFADFGKMMVDTQKQITTAAVQEEKKRANEAVKEARKKVTEEQKLLKQTAAQKARDAAQEQRATMARDKTIAQNYLKEHLRAIDERVRVEKRQEEELARWKERVRANSAQLEQRENVRLAREAARERAAIEKNNARNARSEVLKDRRMDRAMDQFTGGVGNIARGVAYTGLIGQQNTQTILNTIAGVEGAGSIFKGGESAVKGASKLTGMAIGAGGAAAGSTAAIAALVAWLPALASAVKGAAVVIQGSASTHKGDISGGFGEGIAATYSGWLGGMKETPGRSQFFTDPRGGGETLLNPYIQAGNSARAAQGTAQVGDIRRAAIAQQSALLGQLGSMQREATSGNLTASRSMASSDVQRFQTLSAGGQNNEAVAAAYENARQSMEQVKRLSIDSARAQIDGSRDYVENLRNAAQLAKQAADEAKRGYENDAMKLGASSHEEIALYREVARKKKSGEALNQKEIEAASGLSGYEDYARSEAVRRAESLGLGDVLAPSKEKARQTEQKAAATQIQSWASEVDVEMKHEVIVKLEGENFVDQLKEQFGDSIAEMFTGYEERLKKTLEDKIKQAQVTAANARSPTR